MSASKVSEDKPLLEMSKQAPKPAPDTGQDLPPAMYHWEMPTALLEQHLLGERKSSDAEIAEQKRKDWQAKFGTMTEEELTNQYGEEFLIELEKPCDRFNIGFGVSVSQDPEQAAQAEEFISALQNSTPDESCPDTIEVTVKYENGLKKATLGMSENEPVIFDVNAMTFSARVLLYPIDSKEPAIGIKRNGRIYQLASGGILGDLRYRQLVERNKRCGYKLPSELLPKKSETFAPRNAELGSTLCFTGDNIHRATFFAFARTPEWQDGENYFKEFTQEMANLKITIGLPNGEKAASIWEFIQRGGAAMVKAHYALWARYYEQVDDGFEMQDVVVNINDFCRDLGYAKATNGGYKPEAKRRAMQLLSALTSAEMSATYQVQGTKKGHTKTKRLKGTLWRRGLEAEEKDTYEDLLGNARAGNPEEWIPSGFSFSPGAWYADKEWRRQNKYVGKIGAGLMQLRVDQDEWAILIGGYLGTLARTGMYRNRRLKIGTILENTGLAQSDTHRKTEHRQKFYRALDRLIEEKVIAEWKTEGFDDNEVDPEDLAAVAEYGTKNPFPAGDWRGHIVEFTFDFAADMHRLGTRKTKAIAAKTKRAKKETESKNPPTPRSKPTHAA